MDNKLKEDIELVVTNIFSEKEQADQKKKTQDALNESANKIEDLTQKLEDIEKELTTAKSVATDEIAVKESELSKTKAELEAIQTKLEKTEADLSASEESLEDMKKDQLAEVRMSELKDVKVAMGTDIESQTAKVREMSDDDFATYKTDRVELRDAVKKELEDAAATVATQNDTGDVGDTDTDNTDGEATASTDGNIDADTVPADIHVGHAVAAALNFETNPSDDMVDKYAKMGQEMANSLNPHSDK